MHLRSFVLLLAMLATRLSAQSLSAPCARVLLGLAQDSITWTAQPCAGFGGYVLYQETNGAGFVRLDTILNPNQFGYQQPNPGEIPRLYRLSMICNGTETAPTISTSNQRPITPDLRGVSIIGDKPLIAWNPSPSPEVIGYQLYKENPYGSGNYFPYPAANQLANGLQYLDAAATDLLARYAIVAVSACNKSLLGEGNPLDGTTGPHTSIALRGTPDSCRQTLTLSWNAYENWRVGVQRYEIWVGINGQTPQRFDSTTATQYTYNGLQDLDSMEVYVQAIENPSEYAVRSNVLRFTARTNRPMDFIYLTELSYDANGQIELGWRWDTDVDFVSAQILRDNASAAALSSLLPAQQQQTLPAPDTPTAPLAFQLQSLDRCGLTASSNLGKTIFLQGSAEPDFQNRLAWTPFELGFATVTDYQLFRTVGNQTQRLATLSANDLAYTDAISVYTQNEYNSCYYVVASADLRLPNGQRLYTQSRSNTVCLLQNAVAYLPNAFSPEGHNRVFKPYLVFGNSVSGYQLRIFDRYGGEVFASTQPNNGWDGTKNGEALPIGVYTYALRFTQPDGQTVELRGTVMLVR